MPQFLVIILFADFLAEKTKFRLLLRLSLWSWFSPSSDM
jgi:hypothetical protein